MIKSASHDSQAWVAGGKQVRTRYSGVNPVITLCRAWQAGEGGSQHARQK